MAYFRCHGGLVEARPNFLQRKKIPYQGHAKLPWVSKNLLRFASDNAFFRSGVQRSMLSPIGVLTVFSFNVSA